MKLPDLNPYSAAIKLYGGLLLVVLVLAGLSYTHVRAYSAGKHNGGLEANLELQKALTASERQRGDALERLTAANTRVYDLERAATEREAELARLAQTRIRTVERVIRENPVFAATRRPADLDRVRDDALVEIGAAADRAPVVPRAGVQALPGAGEGLRAGSRRD